MARSEAKLDELFLELDQIVDQLEKEDLSLEDSFRVYNEGMKVLKKCNDSIDRVEKKLISLGKTDVS